MNEATCRLWCQMLERCGFVIRQQYRFGASPIKLELMRNNRLVDTFIVAWGTRPDRVNLADFEAQLRAAVLRDAREHPPRTSRTY